MNPVFTDLSQRDLLERCVLGATENQNESKNNIIWSGCTKTEFYSLMTVEVADSWAVLTFNHGMEDLSPLEYLVSSPPDAFTIEFFALQDADKR